MNQFRILLAIIVAVVPTNHLRVILYRLIFKYKIDSQSRIGAFTVLLARRVVMKKSVIGPFNDIRIESLEMADDAYIGKFNMMRTLKRLKLDERARIHHKNFIGGTYGTIQENGQEELILGRGSQISLSCFLDLSDKIELGDNVVVAGAGTQFWTHGFDHSRIRSVASIEIGDNVFIGAASTVVQGVRICSNVVVGAGSVVHRSVTEPGLYVSNNLVKIGK